jgi:hypothetical protein
MICRICSHTLKKGLLIYVSLRLLQTYDVSTGQCLSLTAINTDVETQEAVTCLRFCNSDQLLLATCKSLNVSYKNDAAVTC